MSEQAEQRVKGEPQEQYEDDFEKDLDWLINEGGGSDGQSPVFEEVEAQIDKELEEEARWPSPYDSRAEMDRDGGSEPIPLASVPMTPPRPAEPLLLPQPEWDGPDEERRYILEKIQRANQELEAQESPGSSLGQRGGRRLQFKDSLVDLVVPPAEDEQDMSAPLRRSEEQKEQERQQDRGGDQERDQERAQEQEVAGKMSELQISERQEDGCGASWAGRQGQVLVEKDGKFDLVSLKDVEGHALLPPLSCSNGDCGPTSLPPRLEPSMAVPPATEPQYVPKPPPRPARNRPSSVGCRQRAAGRGPKRRARSASSAAPLPRSPPRSTFTLSAQQRRLQAQQRLRRERMQQEEEQRRRQAEEQRRQENELAFQAWVQRKRGQQLEERRVLRAQELERATGQPSESCTAEEAFKLWLRRKQQQQLKERQLERLRRLEEESCYCLHSKEESERAFRLWLKRKQAEKWTEMHLARERSHRLVMEARRARRMQDLLCSVSEAQSLFSAAHQAYHY